MKGYKVFNSNWTCRDFQYEVGKEFKIDEKPEACSKGFHFCKNVIDCFNYYDFDSNNKVAEVEALGELDTNDNKKFCTNHIKIVRELNWHEVLELVNTGKDCTGKGNSGNWNSGNCNSGNWNSTNYSSGCFCTVPQKIMIFDTPSDMTFEEWRESEAYRFLNTMPRIGFIYAENMTKEEKEKHPEHKTTGGYLKKPTKEDIQAWWDGLLLYKKDVIKSIPNFDAEKFEICTGIKVE